MRLLTETPTHHPKNPVNSENSNHPTQGTRCNPGMQPAMQRLWPDFLLHDGSHLPGLCTH
jgi:hypothetical protein